MSARADRESSCRSSVWSTSARSELLWSAKMSVNRLCAQQSQRSCHSNARSWSVPPRDIIKLASKDPFARQPAGPDITRFVNILAKRLPSPPPLPLSLPSDDDWVLRIIGIEDRFVLGLYRRQMKAISYLGKIEKLLGVPATNRNWNTIEKVAKILKHNSQD